MAAPNASVGRTLIAGQYAVDTARPMPGWGGGMTCFVATDTKTGRSDRMALLVRPDAPPRAQVLNALTGMPIEGVLAPVAQGVGIGADGEQAWFIICPAPPGPPIWGPHGPPPRRWHELEMLNTLLRPVAQTLERLQARHVTHRAIRPENMFRGAPNDPVALGCAWAAPAASLQSAVYEPPYVAMCLANGRGEGSIADDVYALGVTLLVLATGRVPMAGMDDATIIRRKLELGSFAALAGEDRLSPAISDLVRGMLAEDPDHRPHPTLLADPAAARARRVAARPARRAQRPLDIEQTAAVNLRSLALGIALAPDEGARQLRSGAVDKWLRRSLGDSAHAAQLDELVRGLATGFSANDDNVDALMASRAVAILDPLAPLTWRGVAIWPDGLGPALAGQGRAPDGRAAEQVLGDMIGAEAAAGWAALRPERGDPMLMRVEAHQHRTTLRTRGPGGGIARLRYTLNPLLPCRSPLVGRAMVVRLADLLPALELTAATRAADAPVPMDGELGAFLVARHEHRVEHELLNFAEARTPADAALIVLRLLAGLQSHQHIAALPHLAAWLGARVAPLVETWANRPQRARIGAALTALSVAGQLGPMLALLDDVAARQRDHKDAAEAAQLVAAIAAELGQLEAASVDRAAAARHLGHEIALGIGMTGLVISLVATMVV